MANTRKLTIAEEAKLKALRKALIEGEKSGPPESFDFDEFRVRMRATAKRSTAISSSK